MAASREVVVTGVGAVTPYGVGVQALWDGLLSGRPTARLITRFDTRRHRVRFACEVADFDPSAYLPRRLVHRTDPFTHFALVAAAEALGQADLLDQPSDDGMHLPVSGADPERVATVIASGSGGASELASQSDRLADGGPDHVGPYLTAAMPVDMAGAQVALRHRLRGASFAVVSACASGSDALGVAADLIRAGRADIVVAGGAEAAITPLQMAGFAAAGALSRRNDHPARASRPFDVGRDGFVCGEGAGVVILEGAAHATARGAPHLAVLAGYGATNDAHHVVAPPDDGEAAARAVRLALADAGCAAADVGHVNAHGTSTRANDAAEAAALRTVFGPLADDLPVTSTKSAIGHLLGAAGAVEAVVTIQALREGVVPASLNLDERDPACDLDVVHGRHRTVGKHVAISNSFGFGGHNAVLVLARAAGDPDPR